jgi:hypothetical protein
VFELFSLVLLFGLSPAFGKEEELGMLGGLNRFHRLPRATDLNRTPDIQGGAPALAPRNPKFISVKGFNNFGTYAPTL